MEPGEADLGERLRTMTVTGVSADGAIHVTVSGDNRLRLRFEPGRYRWYDEPGLSRQLSALGTTTWVAWTRKRAEVVRLALGQSRDEAGHGRSHDADPVRERFAEAVRALACEGVSASGAVRVHLTGAARWQVEVADGTIRDLPESAFTAEVESAFTALIRDRTARLSLLRAEYFDVGVPGDWLRRAQGTG